MFENSDWAACAFCGNKVHMSEHCGCPDALAEESFRADALRRYFSREINDLPKFKPMLVRMNLSSPGGIA